MDKETLSNYGWIVICVLVLAVMLALSSPFGSFVAVGVKSTTAGLFDTNQKALNTTGLVNIDDQSFDDGTIPLGGTYTTSEGIVLSGNSNATFPDAPATGDKYEYGDYIYTYNKGGDYGTEWTVAVKDTTKSSYGTILSEIAGKSVSNMYKTFYYCKSLTTAPTIPNSVTDMSYTFYKCTSLTTAPDMSNASSVTNMYGTFFGCTRLRTVPTMPSSVTNMYRTFYECKSLTTAPAIPNSVTNMDGTFDDCTSLTTAPVIPNGVINMQCTFYYCTSLTTAPTIPNSVTTMYSTFEGCTSLTTAPTIPSSVKTMDSTFEGCTSLTGTITINTNTRSYYNCLYETQITSVIGSTPYKSKILATK